MTDGTTIPVVTLQTGSSRSAMYPGVYREPRVRTYSDKIAAPTAWNVPKNITFSALIYGASMDEIYAKFQKIESLLDRAQIFSSPFSRGTGVVFLEQLNDAQEFTCWDVISGVLTDVDMNLPGVDWVGAIVQLVVSPYSRGTPQVLPYGSTITNGVNGKLYIPNVLGDAPGIFEFRLTDVSDVGNYITWVTVGRRWYPQMASSDFTPIYAEASSITTSAVWQQILAQSSAAGKHQTGLFDVYAMVNDASPVIGPVTSFTAVPGVANSGGLPNGTYPVMLIPRDGSGNAGTPTGQIPVTIANLTQGGGGAAAVNPLDLDYFANSFPLLWASNFTLQPGLGTGSSATGVFDTTAAMGNPFGLHLRAVGGTTGASDSSIPRALPLVPASKIISIQVPFVPITMTNGNGANNPVTWGEFQFTIVGLSSFTGIFWDSGTSKWCGYLSGVPLASVTEFSMTIAATTLAGAQTLPLATIALTSAAGFDAATSISPKWAQVGNQLVKYTGISGNNLTGCTGGTGLIANLAAVNQAHIFEFNFDAATEEYTFRVFMDGALQVGMVYGNTSTSPQPLPSQLTIQANPFTGNTHIEEFYIGGYYCGDNYIGAGTSFNGGSITVNGTLGSNTSTVDLLYFSGGNSWYQLPAVTLPYTLTSVLPPGVKLIAAPPAASLVTAPAQIRARLGAGAAPVRFQPASIVRTKRANGTDEMVKLGTLTLPPGSKGEYRDLDGWTLALDGKSGATNTNLLTVKGLYLFPADEEGVSGFTAKALGLTQTCEWRIGWNRFGRPYAMLFATSGGAFLGYADISGGLAIMPGDNQFVVLVQKDDGAGNLVADNVHLKYQLGAEWTPRAHFEQTMIPVS